MGIATSLFGGGGGQSFSDFSIFGSGTGDVSRVVPIAPRIPDVVQPSDPQVQRVRAEAKGRSTFLGRTRGGTLVTRGSQLQPANVAALATLLGRR